MVEDNTAAMALDRMREGGTYVVAMIHQRLDEARESLNEGDFPSVTRRLQEALTRANTLSQAFLAMGEWDCQRLIRGHDVEEGMVIWAWGRVESVDAREDDPHQDGDEIIMVTLENGEKKKFFGQQELVLVEDETLT